RSIVQIAITITLTALLGPGGALSIGVIGPYVAAAAGAAIVTGLSGGKVGDMLKAGAIAAATAFAFNQVGTLTLGPGHSLTLADIGTGKYFANIAGHAGVGCVSSLASGGSCQSGALAAAAGATVTPVATGTFGKYSLGGLAVTSIAGGLASLAG